MNREWIERRFAKSMASYAQAAVVQGKMAENLCDLITLNSLKCDFDRIFEVGCGSGVMTQEFLRRFGVGKLILNDLVEESGQLAPKGADFIGGDIELLEFPTELDLVISNAVFQWINEPKALVAKVSSALKAQGILAFSVFGKENCREISQLTRATLQYKSREEWQELLAEEFEILACQEELHQLFFSTAEDVLRHLKATGVTATGGGERWSRGKLKQFYEEYNTAFGEEKGLPLTYHPILFLARKS